MQSRDGIYLENFSGEEANSNAYYRETWRPSLLIELMRLANPPHPFGLLGYAIDAEEYTNYTALPFQPMAEPIVPDIGSDSDTWSRYNLNSKLFNQQESGKSAAVGCIVSRLGETAREVIRDPISRRFHQDLGQIMIALDRQFLGINHQDLEKGMEKLREKYNIKTKINAHVAKHQVIHKLFLDSGNPFNEKNKNDFLVGSVSFDSELNDAIRLFYLRYPDIRDQTFDRLKETVIAAANNRRLPVIENEYANLTTGVSRIDKLEAEIASLRAENNKLKSQKSPKITKQYCFTHGATNHSSRDCFRPGDGHKREATFEDTMGGSMRGVKRS